MHTVNIIVSIQTRGGDESKKSLITKRIHFFIFTKKLIIISWALMAVRPYLPHLPIYFVFNLIVYHNYTDVWVIV